MSTTANRCARRVVQNGQHESIQRPQVRRKVVGKVRIREASQREPFSAAQETMGGTDSVRADLGSVWRRRWSASGALISSAGLPRRSRSVQDDKAFARGGSCAPQSKSAVGPGRETYTWDVLPEHLKTGHIAGYVVKEWEGQRPISLSGDSY